MHHWTLVVWGKRKRVKIQTMRRHVIWKVSVSTQFRGKIIIKIDILVVMFDIDNVILYVGVVRERVRERLLNFHEIVAISHMTKQKVTQLHLLIHENCNFTISFLRLIKIESIFFFFSLPSLPLSLSFYSLRICLRSQLSIWEKSSSS